MPYAIITENDESEWSDVTGISYHFPKRYVRLLGKGTHVIYYKGKLTSVRYRPQRLTDSPHYFGMATIGQVYPDVKSRKGDHFAEIIGFRPFVAPVDVRNNGELIERIPEQKQINYWRDGVRPIDEATYETILSLAKQTSDNQAQWSSPVNDSTQGSTESLTSAIEGRSDLRLVTTYERDANLREAAVRIHGTTCVACGFNFASVYGQHGAGFIHVHHLAPLADEPSERLVDATAEMTVVCPNCHAMIHRYRNRTLSIDDLRRIVAENKVKPD